MSDSSEISEVIDVTGQPVPQRRVYQRITPERLDKFIAALRATGSVRMACRAASGKRKLDTPYTSGDAYRTFADHAKRSPTFAAEWANALNDFQAKLEAEVARRCFVPDTRPMVDRQGQPIIDPTTGKPLAAESWMAANALSLRTLSKLDPAWVDQRNVKQDVSVSHDVGSGGGAFYCIKPDEVEQLSQDEQMQLLSLLGRLEDIRAELKTTPAPAALPAPGDE